MSNYLHDHLLGLSGLALYFEKDDINLAAWVSKLKAEHTDEVDLFVNALPKLNLNAEMMNGSLSSLLWHAEPNQIMLLKHEEKEEWVIVVGSGVTWVRVITRDNPIHPEKITKSKLALILGKKSRSQETVGIMAYSKDWLNSEHHQVSSNEEKHGEQSEEHHHESPVIRYFKMLAQEKTDIINIVIYSLVTGLLYLALPLAANALVTSLAFGGQSVPVWQALLFMTLALLACLILSAIIRGMSYYLAEVIQRRLFIRLAGDLVFRLPKVDKSEMNRGQMPELMNRFLEIVTLQKSTAVFLLDGISIGLSLLIGILVLGLYHPFLLIFVIVLIMSIAFIVIVLGRNSLKSSIEESKAKYEMVHWFEEMARYPKLFKGCGGKELAIQRVNRLAKNYLEQRRQHFKVLVRQLLGLLSLEVIATAVLLIVGGWLVISQELSLGQLVASELIVGSIVASLTKLNKIFESWYDVIAAADKIGHLLDIPLERRGGDVILNGEKSYQVNFENFLDVASGIDQPIHLKLPVGSWLVVYGEDAENSTYFLDALYGLRENYSGKIKINELSLKLWDLEIYRESVMYFADHEILEGNWLLNVGLNKDGIHEFEVQRALNLVKLDEVDQRHLCDNIQTGGWDLTQDERLRLLFARAITTQPKLLLLDHEFDLMTVEELEYFVALLKKECPHMIVVLATCDKNLLKMGDYLISLKS